MMMLELLMMILLMTIPVDHSSEDKEENKEKVTFSR